MKRYMLDNRKKIAPPSSTATGVFGANKPLNFSGFQSPPNQTVGKPSFQLNTQNAPQNVSFGGAATPPQQPAATTQAANNSFGSGSFSFGKAPSFSTPTSGFSALPQSTVSAPQTATSFAAPKPSFSFGGTAPPGFGTTTSTTSAAPLFGATTSSFSLPSQPTSQPSTQPSFGTTGLGTTGTTGLGITGTSLGTTGSTLGTTGSTLGTTGITLGTTGSTLGTSLGTIGTTSSLGITGTSLGTTGTSIGTSGTNIGTTATALGSSTPSFGFGTTSTPVSFGTTTTSAGFGNQSFGTTTSSGLGFGTSGTTAPSFSATTTGLSLPATSAPASTGLSFATTQSSLGSGLGFGTTSSGGLGFGTKLTATTAASTAASITAPSGITALGKATSAAMPTLTTATTTTAAPPAQITSITFAQLEENINKWTLELEEQEKTFINQATQINAWDRLLIANGEKIVELNDAVQTVKNEQESLEHELEFVLAQQRELEELLAPLHALLPAAGDCARDAEREHMYSLAENLDTQLRQMSEDLKEVIEHLNETNRSQDSNDPIVQIGRILNAHMSSMQWVDNSIAHISNKLDQLKATHDTLRRDNERSFQLTYN
ncbi:nuclear pore glycoprotein p62 isoform X2 [Plodia interpunctella]|uniref:nuclear pore glycoprotein p62 isoform X2 n=1 Tax=Plodia interpunctella TaxID=58824 RepID=UPI0023688117|nr:nuclear pore glycoprotein p62 isoform X2 [Plodia interpunctella]